MICQNCGKREAKNSVDVMRGERTIKMQLCDHCAGSIGFEKFSALDPEDRYFSAFFGGVVRKEIVCPVCGTRLSQFLSSGYVGCAVCYRVFPDVFRVAESFHGKAKHVGKFPPREKLRVSKELAMEKIKKQIKQAVQEEDYSLASELKRKLVELGGEYVKK